MKDRREYFQRLCTPEDLEKIAYVPTFPEFLEKIKNLWGEKEAVSDGQNTYTYNELVKRVAMRRQFLYDQGFKAGDKIAVMTRTSIDAFEWYLAVPSAGMVLMMLPVQLDETKLVGCTMKFGYSAIIAEEMFMPLCEKAPTKVFDIKSIGASEGAYGEVEKKTVAAIYFTGGTTGAPKGAVLSQGALMRGAHNGIFRATQVWDNRYIAMLPLSHIFGSVCGFLTGLYSGSYIYACPDMKMAVGLIPVVKPTCLVVVPGLGEIIVSLAKVKGKAFLGNLNTLIVGAAPVPPRLMNDFRAFGITPFPGYGLTEGANLTLANMEADEKPYSMGQMYPDQEYRIENGELWIKGDNVMEGYYNDPEKTAEVMEDGWLKTGDLVTVDEEGYFTIVGRIKNLIILPNGENVSPEEVEEVYYKEDFVKDCLISEGELNGEAIIQLEILPYGPAIEGKSPEEIQAMAEAVVEKVNATVPTYWRVSKVSVRTEDFKRSGAMKILRN